jgi:hypothetical protein
MDYIQNVYELDEFNLIDIYINYPTISTIHIPRENETLFCSSKMLIIKHIINMWDNIFSNFEKEMYLGLEKNKDLSLKIKNISKLKKIYIISDKDIYWSNIFEKLKNKIVLNKNLKYIKQILNDRDCENILEQILIIIDLKNSEIFENSKILNKLIKNNVQYNIALIIIIPINNMFLNLCLHSDYIFLFKDKNIDRRYIYYGTVCKTKKIFSDIIEKYTNDKYKCIIIDNNIYKKDPREIYKYYDFKKLILKKYIEHWQNYIKYKKRERINNEIIDISFLPSKISNKKVLYNGGFLYKELLKNWEKNIIE